MTRSTDWRVSMAWHMMAGVDRGMMVSRNRVLPVLRAPLRVYGVILPAGGSRSGTTPG